MTTEPRGVDDVVVVGGGDIGLLTGLCIRRLNPDIEIAIVDDFEADPPEVGKSTFREIVDVLHGFLGISPRRFIEEARPLWKGSVYFRDWCGCDPFHYPFDDSRKYPGHDTQNAVEQYYLHYHELHDDPDCRTVDETMVEERKSPLYYEPGQAGYTSVGEYERQWAYHLDLRRFNAFLRTVCEEREVDLVDAEITSVETDGQWIRGVASDDGRYEADLYVDASGFNRVLKGELDDQFRAFELPLDAAVTAKVERPLADAVPATVIDSGDHGWFWQIDTYDFRDRGYVYASDYVSDDTAAAEFVAHCDGVTDEDALTTYTFDSGYYRHPWQGNCVTIGNAVGFVEPLQSTGLTANAQAARRLANLLSSHGRLDYTGTRDLYNGWTRRLWESIYDFVAVHYRHAPGDTAFWDAARSIPASQRLRRLEQHFDRNGYDTKTNPIENTVEEAESRPDVLIFPTIGFYTIMRNMGVESTFYEENTVDVSDEVRDELGKLYESMAAEADQLLTIEEVYEGLVGWE